MMAGGALKAAASLGVVNLRHPHCGKIGDASGYGYSLLAASLGNDGPGLSGLHRVEAGVRSAFP